MAAQTIAQRAIEFIHDGDIVGLGTGRAATAFIEDLGGRVAAGMKIRGVPTSQASADLAARLRIPLVSLDEIEAIDVTIDGADEVDPQLDLIKGLGGALVREKIVAAAARKFVVLVGDEKIVGKLGEHGVLPVEVVPFALAYCQRELKKLGWPSVPRERGGKLYLTDNGNPILDWQITGLDHAREIERKLHDLPGVVGTGLFLGMADVVLVQRGDRVEELRR